MQQILTNTGKMDQYKTPFLRILFNAFLALTASALVLIIAFVLYTLSQMPEDANRKSANVIAGNSLQVVIGEAQPSENSLDISAYQHRGSKYHALVVSKGTFQAEDYPLLAYQVDSAFPGPVLEFIWWTASDPETPHSVNLNRTANGESWLALARNPQWRGTIREIGVHVIASAPGQRLSITRLAFEPYSWRGALASCWSAWTSFRGWSPHSINYQYGTPDRNELSPVFVAAVWSALALLLLFAARTYSGPILPGASGVAILVPWILLDLQWQNELMTQLSQTREQFAGKTTHEKHLADIDGDIYRYITRLKTTVLREELSRIVILQDSSGHNFERLKAQYYLLPNNVNNVGNAPRTKGSENLNYILVLGEVPDLEFRADTNILAWDHGKRKLRARLEDEDPMGKLYKIRHPRRMDENKEP